MRIVNSRDDGIVTPNRLWAAWQIAKNPRVHQRLSRIATFGKNVGLIHKDELDEILSGMDVPAMRLEDMGWLNRNLGIRNGKHPNFKRARELIKNRL